MPPTDPMTLQRLLLDLLQWIAKAGERENELLRRYGFVFDKWPIIGDRAPGSILIDSTYGDTDLSKCSVEERWQALAFSMHTRLWEIAQKTEQLLADDADQLERNGWRDISTAPKDGNPVLLYWPHWKGRAVIGYFAYTGKWCCIHALTDGPGPTHWRPLPEPPEAK